MSICSTCDGKGRWTYHHRDHHMDFNEHITEPCPNCDFGRALAENEQLRKENTKLKAVIYILERSEREKRERRNKLGVYGGVHEQTENKTHKQIETCSNCGE